MSDPTEHRRRSLYLFRKRNVRYPMFDAFDAPDTQTACPQRGSSIHALQPLVTLNSQFALDRAAALAGRVYREAGTQEARISLAYQCVLSRLPIENEITTAKDFLASQAKFLRKTAEKATKPLTRPSFFTPTADPAEAAAWVDFALAMLNRNEFLYVP